MCLQYVMTRLDLLRTPKAPPLAPAPARETDDREPVGATH